jgi:FMN-dependent NADH-azoreductase
VTRVLHVIVSPRGTASMSRALTGEIVAGCREARADVEVDEWDLWTDPPTPFGPAQVEAKMAVIGGDSPTGAAGVAWDGIRRSADRFAAADAYVLGVPMWNNGIPWPLKLLIDTVTQPGLVFRFDPATGYHGLLEDKRAGVAYTSRVYQPGAPSSFGRDFHSTYVDDWLRFTGITDVRSVRLQPTRPASPGYPDREAAARTRARAIGHELAAP